VRAVATPSDRRRDPALGLIREREEREAVGRVGITDVYNLDKVDFYYSVSAPLHQQAWGARETLGRLVRVVRQTTPDIVMAMNPAPSPATTEGTRSGPARDRGLLRRR
jgi:LmbE family N-acetylglucosaminyl deacetylase